MEEKYSEHILNHFSQVKQCSYTVFKKIKLNPPEFYYKTFQKQKLLLSAQGERASNLIIELTRQL